MRSSGAAHGPEGSMVPKGWRPRTPLSSKGGAVVVLLGPLRLPAAPVPRLWPDPRGASGREEVSGQEDDDGVLPEEGQRSLDRWRLRTPGPSPGAMRTARRLGLGASWRPRESDPCRGSRDFLA